MATAPGLGVYKNQRNISEQVLSVKILGTSALRSGKVIRFSHPKTNFTERVYVMFLGAPSVCPVALNPKSQALVQL